MSPTISVVIPTFNRSGLLVEAIESVLRQTHPPQEIIVVDDGSTDDTPHALARFGTRVTCHRQKNSGQAVARNQGVKIASGDYVAFLDSDDLWVERRLELQVSALTRQPQLDFLFGLEAKFEAEHQSEACEIQDPVVRTRLLALDGEVPSALELLICENVVPTSTVLVRKSCCQAIPGMDPSIQPVEDYDFWLRLAHYGARFGFVNAFLCRRRMHEGNLVKQWVRLRVATAAVLERHLNTLPAQRPTVQSRLDELYYDLGSHHLRRREFSTARRYLRQSRHRGPVRVLKLLTASLLSPFSSHDTGRRA
jgi:glycosyltransferase involved in cell wall biosynthesis